MLKVKRSNVREHAAGKACREGSGVPSTLFINDVLIGPFNLRAMAFPDCNVWLLARLGW